MAGVNKVILVGNLGADPEVRHLENGASVASFRVATTESYKDKTTGERKDITEWHSITAWRGLAEIAEKYLKKGSKVYVEGKLRTRQWQDKENNTRYTTEVIADTFQMLDSRPGGGEQGGGSYASATAPVDRAKEMNTPPPATDSPEMDDLPF